MQDAGELTRLLITFVVGALSPVLVRYGTLWLERKQRLRDRSDDFRRETLLALQDSLNLLINRTAQLLYDLRQKDDRTEIDGEVPGTDWGLPLLESFTDVKKYAVRVANERVRDLSFDAVDCVYQTVTRKATRAESDAAWNRAIDAQTEANDRIGELLRKL